MRWLRSVAARRKAPGWLTQWEYAHRGLHGPKGGKHVPENSLLGARLVIEAGMGIECDIQRSADDHPMVFHEWDLKRLTGDRKSTRLNSSHSCANCMPASSCKKKKKYI